MLELSAIFFKKRWAVLQFIDIDDLWFLAELVPAAGLGLSEGKHKLQHVC